MHGITTSTPDCVYKGEYTTLYVCEFWSKVAKDSTLRYRDRILLCQRFGEALIREVLQAYAQQGAKGWVYVDAYTNRSTGRIAAVTCSSTFPISVEDYMRLRELFMREMYFDFASLDPCTWMHEPSFEVEFGKEGQ